MRSHRIGRLAVRAAALIVFPVLAGATYQGVATALERREHPRPGGMIVVGDHQLHIHCSGEGSPTVVLEAPAAGMSSAWASVQPQISAHTRVCSYDRAGLGWSEQSDGGYDPALVVKDLRTLLAHGNERAPFIVAGHGLGAAFARVFASQFEEETAAVILVDAPIPGAPAIEPAALTRWPRVLPWLARAGVLRVSDMLSPLTENLPAGSPLVAFLNRPDHLSRTAEELHRWDDAVRLASGARIGTGIRVTEIDVLGARTVGFIDKASSAQVVSAIREAVDAARPSPALGSERVGTAPRPQ